MEVKISGYENNRPVVRTFRIAEEPLGDAISEGNHWFLSEAGVQVKTEYALLNQAGEFVGMVAAMAHPGRVVAMTMLLDPAVQTTGTRFKVHAAEQIGVEPG